MKKTCGYFVVFTLLLAASCKPPQKALTKGFHEGCRFYPTFLYEEFDPCPGDKENYDFMHSRPFWIRDSDTLGILHPVDMEIHDYFKATTFIVPSDIAGDSTRGEITYEVNYVPSGEFMPDGSISIFWYHLPLDTLGKPVQHTAGEWFRFSREAQWDTSFDATFRELPAKVFCQYAMLVYQETNQWMEYATEVFFERKGIIYRIKAKCRTSPQVLGPSSDWWRWLEAHWVWMDEPHPDWSRYPINPDSIRYPGKGE